MDYSHLVRNPGKVHAALSPQADDTVLAVRTVKVYIPDRYTEKRLATISSEVQTLAIFAMVVDDKYYAVSVTASMLRLKPSAIATVKIDGDSYLELTFEPGSVVIPDMKVIRLDTLPFRIFDEFIAKGRIPWFMSYEDVARLMDTAGSHANVNFNPYNVIMEMFAAAIARDPKDRTKYWRHVIGKPGATDPSYVAFRSITYGATNTTSRLMGSYFAEGLNSALVNPSTSNEAIEDILRR